MPDQEKNNRFWLPVSQPNYNPVTESAVGMLIDATSAALPMTTDAMADNLEAMTVLRSIPNVWARCMIWQIYFDEYQKSVNHNRPVSSAVQAMIGEWRGFLAALILQRHYHTTVSALKIDFADANGLYLQAAAGIMPRSVAFADDQADALPAQPAGMPGIEPQWAQTVLYYCDLIINERDEPVRVPLGLTSPTTLLCSAADTPLENGEPAPLPFPWFQQGRFVDPLSGSCLTITDIIVLRDWLDQAIRYLETRRAVNLRYTVPLISMLTAFKRALPVHRIPIAFGDMLRNTGETSLVIWTWHQDPAIRQNIMARLLQGACRMNEKLPDLARYSDMIKTWQGRDHILIRYDSQDDQIVYGIYDFATYRRPLLLKDGTMRVRDRSIKISWNSSYNNQGLIESAIQGMSQTIPIQTEDKVIPQLFLPTLYCFEANEHKNDKGETTWNDMDFDDAEFGRKFSDETKGNSSADEANNKKSGKILKHRIYALPLTEQAIEQLGWTHLRDCVSIVQNENEVIVSIRTDSGGCFARKYTPGTDIVRISGDDLPVAAVWPRYSLDGGWNRYYLYSKDNESCTYYFDVVEPVNREHVHMSRTEQSHKRRVYQMQSFPALLRLCAVSPNVHNCLGYLLLREPDKARPVINDQELQISIDFGTSSTVICYRVPNTGNTYSRPEKLVIEPALAQISCFNSSDHIRDLSRYFLTVSDILSPFPTIMQLSIPNQFEYPFLDANVYYQERKDDLFADLSKGDMHGHGLIADIKWQFDVHKRRLIQVYLEQIILMTALHARLNGHRNVAWHFSYPLTTENAYGYIDICAAIVERIQNENLVTRGRVVSMTESEAAARHFLSSNETYNMNGRNMAVIDIGGGTSDIFIYTKAGQIQASVMLGARKMLIDQLYNNKPFFIKLAKDAIDRNQGIEKDIGSVGILIKALEADIEQRRLSFIRDKFTLFIETLFGKSMQSSNVVFGQVLCSQLSLTDSRQKPLFRTIIAFYIGSIYFYCGMLLRYLRDVKKSSEAGIASVCLAGNGSNVLDWILNVDETLMIRQDINAINSQLFLNGAHSCGLERAISVIRSTARKEEAARGLLSQPVQLNNQPIDENDIMKVVLTGLQLTRKDDHQSERVYPAQSNLFDVTHDFEQTQIGRLRVSDYAEFDDYIESFNKAYDAAIKHRYILPIYTSAQPPLVVSSHESDQEPAIIIVKESIGDQVVQSICQTANSEQKNYESPFIIAVSKAVETSMLRKWQVLS